MTRRTTGNRPGYRGALVERSEVAELAAAGEAEALANFPVVDPDDLAEHYWDMYARPGRAVPPGAPGCAGHRRVTRAARDSGCAATPSSR
ncbi:hypothetical protein [Streptomyces sp. DASNCL29]|uniref:hypothetical protein n=1 Tax=Streptomyces sp. DASNCL29 TaxID=2583819 RepID=UPI001F0F758C|nr:hypothetical protein [Streptomyces sp. DASNCL29]